ncbi:MAG: hypothetical protein M1818_002894 [Claussenomyces sp. TS43310]|nr:MAG: hypothetical protein M1818_002894 [Claussenomyces sp. TS43310]
MSKSAHREPTSELPEHRRGSFGTSSRSSTHRRWSLMSTETGESSQRTSDLQSENHADSLDDSPRARDGKLGAVPAVDGRGSHRSHKSRGSGSFLLSKAAFEAPQLEPKVVPKSYTGSSSRRRESPREEKGKGNPTGSHEKHSKARSASGLGIGGSPLATNVTNAGIDREEASGRPWGDAAQQGGGHVHGSLPPATGGLDADSAQIVNLALNLSESRRNARRNISSSISNPITGFGDGLSGGSLKQHLKQQRRSSRNMSPKSDRGEPAMMASPRVPFGRVDSPLQTAFNVHTEDDYHYYFSPSTLARAEKAKNALEIMAQYRRLLQYIPPLKPLPRSRAGTLSPHNSEPSSPSNFTFPLSRTTSSTTPVGPLGRPYNPLQYIRNRKVRRREQKIIDGEAQGFADLASVTSWVDLVSEQAEQASSGQYQANDCVVIPPLRKLTDEAALPKPSQPSTDRKTGLGGRPGMPWLDWTIDPVDMLAEIVWLEQDGNKRIIEDHDGRKVFPQIFSLMPSTSYRGEQAEQNDISRPDTRPRTPDLRVETRVPMFRSFRNELDHQQSESTTGSARQKLLEVTHLDDLNRLGHEHHIFKVRSRPLSDSSASESESKRSRRPRQKIADEYDYSCDILEKQMSEILAKEAQNNNRSVLHDTKGRQAESQAAETSKPYTREDSVRSGPASVRRNKGSTTKAPKHQRVDSAILSDDSQATSGRASLEVPGMRGRPSLEGLDFTAPNSPEAKASRMANEWIPSITMDLSPPSRSRQHSPSPGTPLTHVRSKLSLFRDRSRESKRDQDLGLDNLSGRSLESSPDVEAGAWSDRLKHSSSKTDEGTKGAPSKGGFKRNEEPSGIRGLFKSGRNNVSKVSEMLWKKEQSPASVASSDSSSDELDLEEESDAKEITRTKSAKSSTRQAHDAKSAQKDYKSLDLPTFRSPNERRGRSRKARGEEVEHFPDTFHSEGPTPPRIDIQNASPSPSPDPHGAEGSSRVSSVSDADGRQSSAVEDADARLNAILGLPGSIVHVGGTNGLPVTGLTALENRRPGLTGQRQWSISDRDHSTKRHVVPAPVTRCEVARTRALLLTSGVKAQEIARRAGMVQPLGQRDDRKEPEHKLYAEIAAMNRDTNLALQPVALARQHMFAAKLLSNDIQMSSRMWQESAEAFSCKTVSGLLDRVDELQARIVGPGGLSNVGKRAADEADDVSRDLIENQTLRVKALVSKMDSMIRRRRRRLRWVRRAGWVAVEWVLVGVMWWVWLVVVLVRIVTGVVSCAARGVRWLFWL